MEVGPHVFGDNRLGIWVIHNSNLTDKLKHVLPRFRNAVPYLTDVFLPESATNFNRAQVREAGFFCHMWAIPSGRSPIALADQAVAAKDRQGSGALELNIEMADAQLRDYTAQAITRVRKLKPKLPLRINIATFKSKFMPMGLIAEDPNTYLIQGAYFGNMDGRASESDVLLDMVENGCPIDKASIQYGVLNGNPRVNSLPAMNIRRLRRGSLYSDDLLLDAGLLP